jgi:hypothetical protein
MAEARTEARPTGAAGATRTGAVFMEAADRTTRVEAVDTLAPGARAAGIFSGVPEAVVDSAAAARRAARRWRGRVEGERLELAPMVGRPARREDTRLVLTPAGATAGRVAATAADRKDTAGRATEAAATVAIADPPTAVVATVATAEVTAHREQMVHTAGAAVRGRVVGIHTQIRATVGTAATTDRHRIAAIQG